MPVMPPTWRVPFFWAKVDASQAGSPQTDKRTLIMGPMLPAGSAAADTLVQIGAADAGAVAFGRGSVLARMIHAYRQNDPYGELWCIGLANSGTDAAGTITFSGPATGDGEIALYIAGQKVTIPVEDTDTDNDIAVAAQAEINALDDLPVDAGAPTVGALPLTAKNGGPQGDDIDLRVNYYGAIGGEELPAGVGVAITTPMAGGATPPTLTAAIAAMGDEPFDYIIHPWDDATSLGAIADELDDNTGRWSELRQIYGHSFYAQRNTVSLLSTFGNTKNDQHATCFGFYDAPSPQWEWSAAHVGQVAPSANQLASQPFQFLPVYGLLSPPIGAGRFDAVERNTLLHDGIAVSTVAADGTVQIDRVITTYQKLPSGSSDDSMLDFNTMATLTEIARSLRTAVETTLSRHVLVDDGVRVNANLPIASPKIARGVIIASYADLIARGLAENMDAFKANLVVERSTTDPNRLNVLYGPDLANQLRIFDVLMQFRLQYPPGAPTA